MPCHVPLACGWDTIDGRTKWPGLEEEITKLREVDGSGALRLHGIQADRDEGPLIYENLIVAPENY